MRRSEFRETVFDRDDGCLVPWCQKDPDAAHHVIERSLWDDGGYVPENGASVCEEHHILAEENVIPPQSFWRWIGVPNPPLPSGVESMHVDKWGEPLDTPPWKEHRERIKYPSTRHLPWSHERDSDDTAHDTLDFLTGYELVVTIKQDGSNCMIVKDTENPVRARNGQHADKDHFDQLKQRYWEEGMYEKIPDHLQIFGEWLYAKHSIHYGCDCQIPCEDTGPALRDFFQVFGVYDTRYDEWLSWPETELIADRLNLETTPVIEEYSSFGDTHYLWNQLYELSQRVVDQGHEGIVVRSKYPFHYGQIDERLGKYVRPGHVSDDEEHWSKRPTVINRLK